MQINLETVRKSNEAIVCVRLLANHARRDAQQTAQVVARETALIINKFRYYAIANCDRPTATDDNLPFKHDQETHDLFMVASRNLNDLHFYLSQANQKRYRKAYECAAGLIEFVFLHLQDHGVKG